MKYKNYWKDLEDANPEFKISRVAYSLYCYEMRNNETTCTYNGFCGSELYQTYRNKVMRQYKLKRVLKNEIC